MKKNPDHIKNDLKPKGDSMLHIVSSIHSEDNVVDNNALEFLNESFSLLKGNLESDQMLRQKLASMMHCSLWNGYHDSAVEVTIEFSTKPYFTEISLSNAVDLFVEEHSGEFCMTYDEENQIFISFDGVSGITEEEIEEDYGGYIEEFFNDSDSILFVTFEVQFNGGTIKIRKYLRESTEKGEGDYYLYGLTVETNAIKEFEGRTTVYRPTSASLSLEMGSRND